jgi:2-methylcitrate dehydratase PrpD
MTSLTLSLADFVVGLQLDRVPERACTIAKTGMADCYGVMVAGSADPFRALVAAETASDGAGGRAALVPSGERRRVEDAALVNGVSAHILDYDDVALGGHPSAVLLPAILAVGQVSGSSGAQMLAAYLAGYEVWAELMCREPTPLHEKGWHPTAVRGVVAAAAACAKLRRLPADRCATAIAIAASMACGLVANFGSQTKSLHVGRAAQSAVVASRLAEAGATASLDALEHPSGFLAAFSPRGQAELTRPFQTDDREWRILEYGLSIKRYPLCYAAHRVIDGVLALRQKHSFSSRDVEQVQISTGETQMLMVRNHSPQSALEAKFSMEFAVAAALIAGKVGFEELSDEFVATPAVTDIFGKISYEVTKETMNGSGLAVFDAVTFVLRDGTQIGGDKLYVPKGNHRDPLSLDQLWAKFADCVGAAYSRDEARGQFDMLINLEDLADVDELFATPARRHALPAAQL